MRPYTVDPSKIVSLVLAGAGWFAFIIQWTQHKKNRPILKIKNIKCIANLNRESLTMCANVVNNGNVDAHNCAANYLVLNGQTRSIEDKGRGAWLTRSRAITPKFDQTTSPVEIPSYGQQTVTIDYFIETEPIVTGDPILPYFFPTEAETRSFFIVLILSYGNYQKVHNFIGVILRDTIKDGMSVDMALDLMKFRRNTWWRFWRWRRVVSGIVAKHDSYMESLLDDAEEADVYEIKIH